jgi:hypothetical protein
MLLLLYYCSSRFFFSIKYCRQYAVCMVYRMMFPVLLGCFVLTERMIDRSVSCQENGHEFAFFLMMVISNFGFSCVDDIKIKNSKLERSEFALVSGIRTYFFSRKITTFTPSTANTTISYSRGDVNDDGPT